MGNVNGMSRYTTPIVTRDDPVTLPVDLPA
jgi:hypothetical protein